MMYSDSELFCPIEDFLEQLKFALHPPAHHCHISSCTPLSYNQTWKTQLSYLAIKIIRKDTPKQADDMAQRQNSLSHTRSLGNWNRPNRSNQKTFGGSITGRITKGKERKKRIIKFNPDLPNGGNPPATDDDEGLRMFRGSIPDIESGSVEGSLLPGPLAWDKFCKIMFHIL